MTVGASAAPAARGGERRRYRLNGLLVDSDRAFRFLVAAEAAGAPDVTLRFGPVRRPGAARIWQDRILSLHADGDAFLEVPGAVTALIRGGREITVEAADGATDAVLHNWVFGQAIGILCHQRGTPPLHACVVEIGGRAVALAGHSGSGKSTTARALIARGHGLLTDDQAIIDPDSLLVEPGWAAIKVWANTAAAAGDRLDPALRVHAHLDKFQLPLEGAFRRTPTPLGLVVILRKGEPGEDPRGEMADWRRAAALLKTFVYRHRVGDALDGGRAQFAWSLALARRAPVVTLRRPDDLAGVPALCDWIEQAAAGAAIAAARPVEPVRSRA